MSKAVIPSMPPLSSIQDENTRVAIEALISGWRVRNGEIGDGSEKFLTVNDLVSGLSGSGIQNYQNFGTVLGTNIPPSARWISSLLQRIDDSISQSYLWKKLGEQLEWIETPEWFAGKFGAAIKTEQIQRQTETAALSSAITTAVTNINGNIALVQEELTATSDLAGATARAVTQLQTDVGGVRTTAQNALTLSQTTEGTIRGAWTVKFDAAGYVAGAGLGIEGKNGNIQSAFYVRADRFAIGNPEFPGVAPRIPFKVFTTPQVIGGASVPAGVYIDSAMIADGTIGTAKIADAAITNAKIQDAAVDTLSIAGNAVTQVIYAEDLSTSGISSWNNGVWHSIFTFNTSFEVQTKVLVMFQVFGNVYDGGDFNLQYRVRRDWSTYIGQSQTAGINNGPGVTATGYTVDDCPAGSHSYTLEVYFSGDINSNVVVANKKLFLLGAKR